MKIFSVLFLLIVTDIAFADLLKPNPNLKAEEVISIQLLALKENNYPYENAGINQTWEFAHPSNRMFTGPLEKFTSMMYSSNYSKMLDHKDHKIILVNKSYSIAYFFIELEIKEGNKYGFQWIVKKVINEGNFMNCWMTASVSLPMLLSKSA